MVDGVETLDLVPAVIVGVQVVGGGRWLWRRLGFLFYRFSFLGGGRRFGFCQSGVGGASDMSFLVADWLAMEAVDDDVLGFWQ